MRSSLVLVFAALSIVACKKPEATADAAVDTDAAAAVAAPSAPVDAAVAPITKPVVKPVLKDGGHDASTAILGDAAAPPPTRPTRGAISCEPPGCECETGAPCDISCFGTAACNVTVRELAKATIKGATGAMNVTCKKGSTCTVIGGLSPSVTKCSDATCDVQCKAGKCDLGCSGGSCKISKGGAGATKCDGCK